MPNLESLLDKLPDMGDRGLFVALLLISLLGACGCVYAVESMAAYGSTGSHLTSYSTTLTGNSTP